MSALEFSATPAAEYLLGGTGLVVAIFALMSLFAWRDWRRGGLRHRRFRTWFWPAMLAFELAVFGSIGACNYRQAPIRYRLDDRRITVVSRTRELPFALRAFERVGRDQDGRWRWTCSPWMSCQMQGRIVRGPFGISATTRPPGLPWVNVHVTDPDKVVALEGRVNLLVSPDDPDRFVAEVERRLAEFGPPGPEAPPP